MIDRGTAAFTLATTAIALMGFAVLESLVFFGDDYWMLMIAPSLAMLIAGGVWLALRRICTGAGRWAHAAVLTGIALLWAMAVLGISFGGLVAVPAAVALMVAHAIVPRPR